MKRTVSCVVSPRLLGRGARGEGLAFVEEPQRTGQRHGVEEVRADGDHHIDRARLDQLLANLRLAAARIAGRVRHHEAGAASLAQRTVENLNPQIVAVVVAGQAERKARVFSQPLLVDLIDVEGRVGHHEIKLPDGVVAILVVGVALADVAAEAVHGQIHLAQPYRLAHFLLPVDADGAARAAFMARDEIRALHEHATGAVGRIVDAALIRFDHFHDQIDQRRRRKELAALLAFAHRELAQEVLIDLAEDIALDGAQIEVEGLEERDQQATFEVGVIARQHTAQVFVLILDCLHRFSDCFGDVGAFG